MPKVKAQRQRDIANKYWGSLSQREKGFFRYWSDFEKQQYLLNEGETQSGIHRFRDTREELLSPTKKDLRVWKGSGEKHYDKRGNGGFTQDLVYAECGVWKVNTFVKDATAIDPNAPVLFDFCIAVASQRGASTYSPQAWENAITSVYDRETYAKWRDMVLDDIPNLKVALQALREEIPVLHQSICANDRSRRLCKRVGLPLIGDWVFLAPSCYRW